MSFTKALQRHGERHIRQRTPFTPKDEIIQGACEDVLKRLPTNYVQLAFADPPFNLGKDYGYDDGAFTDNQIEADYWRWAESWLYQLKRITDANGHVAVMCHWKQLPGYWLRMERLLHPKFKLRHVIIYHYIGRTMGYILKYAWQPILLFSGEHYIWNLDDVRVPPSKDRSPQTHNANPLGENPTDVWKLPMVLKKKDRVIHHLLGKHPCQMPQEITNRLIKLCTNDGNLVLDPFMGTGTTAASAKQHRRHYVGIEMNPAWKEAAEERIAAQTVLPRKKRLNIEDYF